MIKNIFAKDNILYVNVEQSEKGKIKYYNYIINNYSNEMLNSLVQLKNSKTTTRKDVEHILYPNISYDILDFNILENSKYKGLLETIDNTVIMPSVSKLSIPQILVNKILTAVKNNDDDAITAYKNFWLLLSLNPNDAVRNQLFSFRQVPGRCMICCGTAYCRQARRTLTRSHGVFRFPARRRS